MDQTRPCSFSLSSVPNVGHTMSCLGSRIIPHPTPTCVYPNSGTVHVVPLLAKGTVQVSLIKGPCDGEMTLYYPGGPSVITEVLIRSRERGSRIRSEKETCTQKHMEGCWSLSPSVWIAVGAAEARKQILL